jgi:hypothetical protein
MASFGAIRAVAHSRADQIDFQSPGARASSLNTSLSRTSELKITGGVNSSCWAMKLIFAGLSLQPSHETRTFCPKFTRADDVSGTKKRT